MWLKSVDGNHQFYVFMRRNKFFQEDFSIGLDYLPGDERGKICLRRYNGLHEQTSDPENISHHAGFHVHKAKAEFIEMGLKPEKYAEITKKYASYEEALKCFIKDMNIQDAGKYFPPEQKSLSFGEEGEE